RANGINNVFSSLIYMVGPMLGGIFLLIFPIELIFMIDIFTFVAALIPLLFITIPSIGAGKKADKKSSFFKEFKIGLKTVKIVPGLLSLIYLAMIINFLWRPFNVLMPFFIKEIHNGTPINLAFVTIFMPIANIIGGIINAFKKNWKQKTFIIMFGTIMVFIGYSFLIIAPKGYFIVIGIGLFIQGMSFNFIIVNYATLLQSSVPSDKVGRIISLDHSLTFIAMPIGSFISGPLAVLIGINNLYLISIVLGIITTILIWIFTDIHKLDHIGKEEILT
ncbi:MAG: MFS transporter, partial [Candidatus Hodarchaeota archaeon]